ncbi:hypothetical protein CCPUN_02890 [Cardinium endosymbiont of Culicoides punctatus]|nr:hypothetical protein CCPUN_02890 [Cardinium endosymbiont of Culicoides punctatus]
MCQIFRYTFLAMLAVLLFPSCARYSNENHMDNTFSFADQKFSDQQSTWQILKLLPACRNSTKSNNNQLQTDFNNNSTESNSISIISTPFGFNRMLGVDSRRNIPDSSFPGVKEIYLLFTKGSINLALSKKEYTTVKYQSEENSLATTSNSGGKFTLSSSNSSQINYKIKVSSNIPNIVTAAKGLSLYISQKSLISKITIGSKEVAVYQFDKSTPIKLNNATVINHLEVKAKNDLKLVFDDPIQVVVKYEKLPRSRVCIDVEGGVGKLDLYLPEGAKVCTDVPSGSIKSTYTQSSLEECHFYVTKNQT